MSGGVQDGSDFEGFARGLSAQERDGLYASVILLVGLVAGADGGSFQVLETGSGRSDVDGQDARSTFVEGRRQAVAVARGSAPR